MRKLHPTHLFVLWATALLLGAGCVHFDNRARFVGAGKIESPPLLPLAISINDAHDFDVVSIPLLITKATSAPPYSFTLVAEDAAGQHRQLVLEECSVVYADNSHSRPGTFPIVVPFERKEQSSRAVIEFQQGIPHEQNFTLQVRGRYVLIDGTEQPFVGRCNFELKRTRGLQSSLVVLSGV
jgi:hypothetical protein